MLPSYHPNNYDNNSKKAAAVVTLITLYLRVADLKDMGDLEKGAPATRICPILETSINLIRHS